MKKITLLGMALLFIVSASVTSCAKKAVVAPKQVTSTSTEKTTTTSTNSDGQSTHGGCGGGSGSSGH